MPPALATCLFSVFILWSLLRDAKKSTEVSRASWLPTAWIALIGTKPLDYWINGPGNQQALFLESDGPPYDAITFFVLIFLAAVVLSRRRIQWQYVSTGNRIFWIFYAYLFFSVFWSDFPLTSLKRYIKELGNVAMILIIVTEKNPIAAIRATFLRCTLVFIPLSILFIKYYGELGRYYNPWNGDTGFSGVTTSKNELGRLAMWSGLFLVWSFMTTDVAFHWWTRLRRNSHRVIAFAMCTWILLKANSATSLGCFFAGLAALLGSRTRLARSNPKLLILGTVCFLLLSALFFTMPGMRAMVAGNFGRKADLTERTDVWQGCFDQNTNPVIGEGFFSFWLTPGGRRLGEKLVVTEAHNGYLETYLNSGLIGVILLLAVIAHAMRNTLSAMSSGAKTGTLFAALMTIVLIYNNTEATFNNNNIVGFLFLLVAIRYDQGNINGQTDAQEVSVEMSDSTESPASELPVR